MVVLLLDSNFSEATLQVGGDLDLRNVGAKVWPRVVAMCKAERLRLYHLTIETLDGAQGLSFTRALELEWATKIRSLSPVFQLGELTSLSVFDFPKLEDLNGIESLTHLKELNLSGSRGSLNPRLRIQSLEPVTRLRALSSLSLTNAVLGDDDLTVLSRCTELRRLRLSNQFDRAQVAHLANRLNPQLEAPLMAYLDTNIPCGVCGRPKVMITGRGMPILCPACNQAKFERFSDQFHALAAGA